MKVNQVIDGVRDEDPGDADDRKLGELVDKLPEPLVQCPGNGHAFRLFAGTAATGPWGWLSSACWTAPMAGPVSCPWCLPITTRSERAV
jgi:hypothetical protein